MTHVELCDKVAAANPEMVAQAEAAGIDWKALIAQIWGQVSPIVTQMVMQLLANLLKQPSAPTK